jgi:hypothetical protein
MIIAELIGTFKFTWSILLLNLKFIVTTLLLTVITTQQRDYPVVDW